MILFQACIPGLHISLGVFYHLYTLVEEACHELDLRVANMTSTQNTGVGGVSFETYVSNIHKLFALKEESAKQSQVVSVLDQLLTYLALTVPQGSPALEQVKKEAEAQQKLLQDVVSELGSSCFISLGKTN